MKDCIFSALKNNIPREACDGLKWVFDDIVILV